MLVHFPSESVYSTPSQLGSARRLHSLLPALLTRLFRAFLGRTVTWQQPSAAVGYLGREWLEIPSWRQSLEGPPTVGNFVKWKIHDFQSCSNLSFHCPSELPSKAMDAMRSLFGTACSQMTSELCKLLGSSEDAAGWPEVWQRYWMIWEKSDCPTI